MAPEIYKLLELNPTNILVKSASNGNITINTTNIQRFRLLQKILLNLQINFHSFTLLSERTFRVVIKGILFDVTNDEMKNELENLNYKVQTVKRFGFPDKLLPMF